MNLASGCLVVAFTESPDDPAALEFQRAVFEKSIRREARGIILDVSGVTLMDSAMSKNLVAICRIGDTLGKKVVVVGLRPAVVASIVDLEIDLSDITAAVNIEKAMAFINPPAADAEAFETNDAAPDEDAEPEEGRDEDDENEAREADEEHPE